jgi:predicted aspartyl protease
LVNDIIAYYGYIAQLENSNNVNKNWITPIDQAVAKETAAFEIDPNTSKLFSNNDQSAAIKNLLLHKALMERNAAGHFWINSSLNGNLQAIKSLTEDLILAIKNELKFLGES